MTPTLTATLTKDRHGQPLVALDGGPFNGLEISPAALRELAGHLDALARLAFSSSIGGKRRRPLVVKVGFAQAVQPTTQQQG